MERLPFNPAATARYPRFGADKKMGAGPKTRPTGGCDREQEGEVSIAATCVALEAQRPGGGCWQTVSLPPHSDKGSGEPAVP